MFEPVKLIEGIGDDPPGSGPERRVELVVGLVVAMHHEPLGCEPGEERHVQLTGGGHVEAESFVADEAGHRRAQEGLPGVDDAVRSERRDVLAAPSPQLVLVVDEQRRAEPLGERLDVDLEDGRREE